MFKKWFCLALALMLAWASLSLAEDIAIEEEAAIPEVSGDELVIEEVIEEDGLDSVEDLELSLSEDDLGLLELDQDVDGDASLDAADVLDGAEAGIDANRSEKLTLNFSKLLIGVKEKCTVLKATRSPEDASDTVTWSSDKKSVVKVDKKTGKLTGVKKGKATITAKTASGLKAKCVVTVKKKPGKVTISPTELSLTVGETRKVKGKIPSGTGSTISYTSSNKKVAKVDKYTGEVTGVAPGTATITAKTFNGCKATCEVTVSAGVAEVFLPQTLTVAVNETKAVTATAADGNGDAVETTFTYSAQDGTGSVSVDAASGEVTGLTVGTATIHVTAGNGVSTHLEGGAGVETVCEVTVVEAQDRVELASNDITIGVGQKYDLNPRAVSANGFELEGVTFTATSSDESVMTVSSKGVVKGVGPGSGVVTVTASNGAVATCNVTVQEGETDEVSYRLFAAYSYYDSLPFVKRNAEGMAKVFKKSNIGGQTYDTKVLGNPSKSSILSGISSFFADADDNDVSIVYFCSHGHNNKSSYTSYRLSLKGYDSNKNDTKYYLTSKEIFNSVQDINGNVILILDSCYSGTFIKDMKSKLDAENGRIAVLTAASNTKASFYTTKAKSVDFFTFFLLQGLGYNEKDGWWTRNADAEEGSYPGYFMADNRGNGDGSATLGEFYSFASNAIDVNIPNYMRKSWYWGETDRVQKTRLYAGDLKNLVIYRPE